MWPQNFGKKFNVRSLDLCLRCPVAFGNASYQSGGNSNDPSQKSENATASGVKRVYKKLALLYHPDKAKGMTKEEAEECFVILTNAYEIVKSRARRNAAPPSDDLKPSSSAVLRTVLIGVGITLVVIAAHTLLKK
ncbi:hypothetical protein RO3G_09291 [Rhizopus delemar RA 99-880]|uniref:J domain-containing protein n=1 Tax=Rhizopus delemar (strain RA 99-880 / ATCC MYA-4621 / FGSC 9543 / NRRL 43880) TaxID=246409 RepID=I1C801_RHIO9|nr:hypothetical protein RO3G_09291 [Rhizopus delemar RA 99-880]KAG1507161.1 hypothetical protein G6F52_011703 [Rhizopus delemar]|eukprot:EIE84581.1 hypothetical protein RO3G_09291 [Rhizopus delemar RA 99-880]